MDAAVKQAETPAWSVHAAFGQASLITRHVKYSAAYYFDENDQPVTVHYTDLQNDEKFLFARAQDLFVDKEKTLRLQVRNGRTREDGSEYGIPHFWAPQQAQFISPLRFSLGPDSEAKENDPRHEARIDQILLGLNEASPKRVITYDFATFKKKVRKGEISHETEPATLAGIDQFVLANVTGFTWQRRTNGIPLGDGKVIPDIVGWVGGVKGTEEKPAVFIEVINTSFPSEKKWQAYRMLTAIKPVIVFFDFLEPYHFQPRLAAPALGRTDADIRVIYYIWKGSVWKNTSRIDARSNNYTVELFKSRVEKDKRSRANAAHRNSLMALDAVPQ